MRYAQGKKAVGVCDICGFEFRLNTLGYLTKDGRRTKLRVCRTCKDEDNPQGFPTQWMKKGPEAIAVHDPRPDKTEPASRSIARWNPVVGEEIAYWPQSPISGSAPETVTVV